MTSAPRLQELSEQLSQLSVDEARALFEEEVWSRQLGQSGRGLINTCLLLQVAAQRKQEEEQLAAAQAKGGCDCWLG